MRHHSLESRQKMRESYHRVHRIKDAEQLDSWKRGQLKLLSRVAKRLLIFEFGEKCSKCGWCSVNPFSNTIPIELEHKNGDCYDNSYDNVCLLCPNCHALTATFRALNAGKGRGRKFYKVVSQWAKECGVKSIWNETDDLQFKT